MERVDVAVVGGGIAGLATAWTLRRERPDLSLVVLEASARAGGKIGSASLLGVPIDTGPDAFLARVEGGGELASELGLDDLVAPATGQAWVWSDGRLHALPPGLVLGVPSDPQALRRSDILTAAGLARALRDETTDASVEADDISVREGIGTHLGDDVVDVLVEPLLGGISAADCSQLSLRSVAPELFEAARAPRLMPALRDRNAALTRGQIGITEERPVFLTPRSGVHSLRDALVAQLGDVIRTAVRVSTIVRGAGGGFTVTADDQTTIAARHVVLALPAPLAGPAVRELSAELASELESVRTASVALVLFAYPVGAVTLPPGSGLLVSRREGRLITAASWWSQKWPHLEVPGHVVIRASAGRDGDERFTTLSDLELADALHGEMAEMFELRARPTEVHVARWMNGFPQYDVGHARRVERAEGLAGAVGLQLVGASYHGVGLPACIRSGRAAAREIIRTSRTTVS